MLIFFMYRGNSQKRNEEPEEVVRLDNMYTVLTKGL